MITREQLIKSYLKFFKSKNHKEIPSSSLVPENDPSVLFTTAGMHPLVPYLLGQPHPLGKRLVSVQKCIRTGDIEEVGDPVHHTFFEMLGNWSLGDYWKKESIEYSFEFLTKILKIPKENLAVSVFAGDKDAPKDTESEKIWLSVGIKKERIAFLGKEDNWWGPAGQVGPCGPDTEIFYCTSKSVPKKFNPKDKCWVEIWNNVFMEYNKDKRLILVDGMHCLYDENFNLNQELLDFVNSFNSHNVLVVNKFREKGRSLVNETNWKVFSLEENGIKKDNPEYFKELLKRFNLIPEEVIYFDHDKKNVETAQKLGILSKHYTDIKSTKRFIEDNLWTFIPLKQKNVDTGMGVERTLAAINKLKDNYETSSLAPLIEVLEDMSNKEYQKYQKQMRVVADHLRAAVFMIADNVTPSNVGRGYILRRLIRRAIIYSRDLSIGKEKPLSKILAETIIDSYPEYDLIEKRKIIESTLLEEENKFEKTLSSGLKEFEKFAKNGKISGQDAFLLFQSHGFPLEITLELAKEKKITLDVKSFHEELKKHQELSKSTSEGMFKSGLADNSQQTTRLHTATHMLNEALRQVLGQEVKQRGSNITPERLRFDFNFPRKLENDEIKKIESLVNEKIKASLQVKREEVPLKKALESGAQSEFNHKYPDKVSTYTILDNSSRGWFSKEICTGPHVKNTKEIGTFKITKEESVAAGIRRIKAIVNSQ